MSPPPLSICAQCGIYTRLGKDHVCPIRLEPEHRSAVTSRCLGELAEALTAQHGVKVKDIKTEVYADGDSGKYVVTLASDII